MHCCRTLPPSQRLSTLIITISLWEEEFSTMKFCNLTEDLNNKLRQFTLKYSLPCKPTPPQIAIQKSSLERLLEDCEKPPVQKLQALEYNSGNSRKSVRQTGGPKPNTN